jgi:outer membrane protein
MKRLIIAVILLVSSTAFAAPPQKIGVVDLQRAVSESKVGIAARVKILQKTEQLNAELKFQLADIEKLRAEFEKDASKLSQEAKLEKERLIQRKSRDLQNRQRESQEEIKQMEADSLNRLLNRLGGILAKLGDEGGYAVILERGAGTTYFSKQVDVTPFVVKMSDEGNDK